MTNVEVDVHMITGDGVNLHGFRRRSAAMSGERIARHLSGWALTGCDMRTVSLQSLVDYHSSVLGNFAPFLDFAWKNCIVLQP